MECVWCENGWLAKGQISTFRIPYSRTDAGADMKIESMDIRRAAELASQPLAVLLDVRERNAYTRGHLRGARNVPYEDILEGRFVPDERYTYYLYCDHGLLSYEATVYLSEMGYHAVNLRHDGKISS